MLDKYDIKCVIFDCDGTLVDSEYLCNLGLKIKLNDYGVETSATEMMKKFRGGELVKILRKLEEQYKIKLDSDFIPSYRALVDELFEEHLKPCEGVSDALADIQLPKCVASSGPIEKIYRALSITGLEKHFNEQIYSSYDVGSWKPDPGIFLHAAKAMGHFPYNCAVVEDSLIGISAAKAAGMIPILYDPDDIHHSLVDVFIIQHMSQLKNVVT